jgi:chloride channel protein, CIC family
LGESGLFFFNTPCRALLKRPNGDSRVAAAIISVSPRTGPSPDTQYDMRIWWYTQSAVLERLIARLSSSLGQVSPNALMLMLATIVGLGAGFTSVGFSLMLEATHNLFFHGLDWLTSIDPNLRYLLALVPALGGLIVGPIIYHFAREAKGHGVPEVMNAVASKGGRMRPRVVVVKAIASAITIGSGGSAGQEGPIVQIGAALGSMFGRLFHLSTNRLKVLVGCGAAAGISAIFNAPIGGVLFALEIILGDFRLQTFSPVVVSAVVASVIAQMFLGAEPAFAVPAYHIGSPLEMFSYLVLGALAGVVAVAFIKMLYAVEEIEEKWKGVPDWLKPAIGGLLAGSLALLDPGVLGGGYPAIGNALNGNSSVLVLALLLVLKPLATSFTLGSGGSGGVFAPSLFLGAMMGGLFGHAMEELFPGLAATQAFPHALVGAYAMVGMGAVVGATTHAWMTSAIIVFEMTDSYSVILPLMLATLVSMLVSRSILPESIYTLKLVRMGRRIGRGLDFALLERLHVHKAMFTNYVFLRPGAPMDEIVGTARSARSYDFPVVTESGRLLGMISLPDTAMAREQEVSGLLVAADLASTNYTPLYADENLATAMHKFDLYDRPTLPVLSREEPDRIIGMLDRRQILNLHERTSLLGTPEDG